MTPIFLIVLVALTSAAAYGWGRLGLGFKMPFLRALGKTLEVVGLAVVFFALNVGITVAGILALRAIGWFISIYIVTDYALIVLSAIQALVFQHWRYANPKLPSP